MAARARGLIGFAVIAGLLVTGAVVAIFVVLPARISSMCVAKAAERGVAITIERTTVSLSSIHLGGVTAKLDGVSAMTMSVSDVDIGLSGFAPTAVTLRGIEISVVGEASAVMDQVDRFRAAHPSPAGAPPTTLESIHVAWKDVLGPGVALDVAQGSANVEPFHAEATRVTLATARESFGPWHGSLTADALGSHARVDLGALDAKAPHATIDRSPTGDLAIAVDVPRTHLATLGLRPVDVGLAPESSPDIATTIALSHATSGKSSLDLKLDLYNTTFSGAPIPVDARMSAAAAGAGNTLAVSHGALVVGPFDASLAGTITLAEGAAKVDLTWRATPIPCSSLAQRLAPKTALGQLGASLAAEISDAAKAFHLAEVTGNTVVSGKIAVDTRNMSALKITLTANETCGISLFP